jgi:rRNA-processing protein FCF1
MGELTNEAKDVLTGNMSNDHHLYVAAVKYDKVVITNDPGLLENRQAIKGVTGVNTISLEEALSA